MRLVFTKTNPLAFLKGVLYNVGMNTYTFSKKLLAGVFLGAVAFLPMAGLAAEFRIGDRTTIQSGENITDDTYIAGGSITSLGKISGDFTAAGGNITIVSDIAEDVQAMGGNILIEGAVGGDVLLGGGQVTINSPRIGGDVFVAGVDIIINAPVAGNVQVKAGRLTLGSRAVISGDLTYSAKKALVTEPGAMIKGATHNNPWKYSRGFVGEGVTKGLIVAIISFLILFKFLTLLVSALVVGLVFRRYAKEVVEVAFKKPLHELGRGFVVAIVFPVSSILLIFSIVGMPIGVIGLFAFAAAMLFSWILAAIMLGVFLHRWIKRVNVFAISWKTIVLGVAAFSFLGLVPVVGWIVQCALVLLALGSAMKLKWSIAKEWR